MSVDIIAEIGINHQNDISVATELVAAAKAAGATTVKFQASTVVEEVSVTAAPDHFAELGRLVPTWDFLQQCKALCDAHEVEFLCTPAGPESLAFVVSLGVKRIKVSSDNLTNTGFLRAVGRTGLPVILSTGMALMPEIVKAVAPLASRQHRLTIMHCVSAYPVPLEQINLGALNEIRRYGILGLSDHTDSKLVPALAVAMGCMVIEKHITLNRSLPGPDHAASLMPDEFKVMVQYIRKAEVALGTGFKGPQPIEEAGLKLYRKSLVAAAPIKMGEMFTLDNVTAKRPGTGIPASSLDSVLGTLAKQDYAQDDLL